MSDQQTIYAKTGRQLIYLLLIWLPLMVGVGYFNTKLAPNESWPFFGAGFAYLGLIIIISARRFIAYYRIRRK